MGDSYRPTRRDRGPPPSQPLADRMTFNGNGNGNGGDTYRPGGQQQSEFTFEASYPAPRFPPSGPANGDSRAPARNGRNGGNRGRGSNRGRGGANGRGRGGPYRKAAAPHERALLQHRDDGQEHTYGVSDGPNRFMNIDDMSDDEEADMVESDASADGDASKTHLGEKKLVRTEAQRADGDTVPKWSNPDPYTALPPPNESTGVKRDMVQLIRKAKNQDAEKAIGNNAVAANDDFISFGDVDDGEDGEVDDAGDLQIYDDNEPSRRGARGQPQHPVQGSMNDVIPNDYRQDTYESYQPTSSSRNRKRKPDYDMPITKDWVVHHRSGPRTPWATDASGYKHLFDKPDKWLHNEILDFYDFVAPKPFEHDAREYLVRRISDALSTQRWFPHDSGRIFCFGSYPAGLYLPTADMDLVYASDRHFNGGPPVLSAVDDKQAFKKTLFKASRRLQAMGFTKNPLVIANARVPIIKFKDLTTGLDVDISFENLSGVQAQATFDQWKADFPDMVFLVALVKQLLVMRGLNEVHTGGLGGFSIICLVISYLQLSDKVENLGGCFLGFLKYYGKEFDLSRQRIQMIPPAIVKKGTFGIDERPEQANGLSIQDPNKPDNNISGGSRKAAEAFSVFGAAYDTLSDRMEASKKGIDVGPSLLDCIIGGNYQTYMEQRHRLSTLHKKVLDFFRERGDSQQCGDAQDEHMY